FPNTPMLGALVKASGVVPIEELLESTRHRLTKKFRNKPEAVEGNIKAIERAYQEVRGE
ncbi:MAG: 2-oxoacid:acceptor oxidoreductase family protein, partial [Bacteroidota bacterium]